MVTPPGVQVNTRYINSTKGTSSQKDSPQWHRYPPFQAHSATQVSTGIQQNQFSFETEHSLQISKLAQHINTRHTYTQKHNLSIPIYSFTHQQFCCAIFVQVLWGIKMKSSELRFKQQPCAGKLTLITVSITLSGSSMSGCNHKKTRPPQHSENSGIIYTSDSHTKQGININKKNSTALWGTGHSGHSHND